MTPLSAALVALTLSAGFTWDIPEASGWVDVPGTLRVQGVPMKLKMVHSKWRAEPLLQHLAERFEQAGLYLAPPERQPQLLKEVQLTALDPETLHTFTFILQPDADGTTLYLAEANAAARGPGSHGELPLFPGAQGAVASSLEGARSVSYRAVASQAEVRQFYTETLTRSGWRAKSEDRFVKDARELTLSLKAQGSLVRVLLWERLTAADAPR